MRVDVKGLMTQLPWQVRQWRQTVKWLLLWLALSCLTILHSLALVLSLGYSLFATISAALFTWSGVLGILGAARALLGLCLARHKPPEDALQSLQLKVACPPPDNQLLSLV